ncbi:hypothetical protein QQS21_009440 [Conoideocrella luteorostrata]|uniref:CFEM domain-containing protein n=1 Tax=Conoideocrella luteorostrata TaxID=1105319 RepID=A0AAJ0FVN0_9HYPO|nr:hypothetical protein QQS21_009440 [Conoideocrella luteorostrata]
MKSSFITLAFAAGLALAQLNGIDIPTCAQPAIQGYITGNEIAGCKQADYVCVCSNKDFLGNISCQLEKDCNKDDIAKTIKTAANLCNSFGVKTPDQLVCNKNAASSGSSSPTNTGSQQTSGTGTSTSATPTRTNAAAPAFGSAGGLLGAALALVAAF